MSRLSGALLTIAGWALWAAGVAVTLGSFFEVTFGGFFAGNPSFWQIWGIFIGMLAGGTIAHGGQRLRLAGRRRRARPATLPGEDDHFVLYLRSFAGDTPRGELERTWLRADALNPLISLGPLFLSGRSLEEHLVAGLRPLGQVIAVAQPGETLPPVGARRLPLPADDWQRQVLDLMSRARLVVIFLDATRWTRWEFSEALRRVPRWRLLLVVPADATAYEAFRRAAPTELPAFHEARGHTPGKRPAASALIYFTGDGRARHRPLVGSPLYDVLGSTVRRAARPALEQLVAHEARLRDPVRQVWARRADALIGIRNTFAAFLGTGATILAYRVVVRDMQPPQGVREWAPVIGSTVFAALILWAVTAMARETRRRAAPVPARHR